MSGQAYYTMIDSKDYLTEGEEWDWNKILSVLNEKFMPEYRAVVGTYCPKLEHFLSAYDNPPIYISASDTKDYSELKSGQLFMLEKQDDRENCVTAIYTNDPDIIREQNLNSNYPSDDDDQAYWEEDWGPV
tara:strand:+ start:1045 stop:1437 length:393 start_codon:yes stop_codon:yes gene_type:complete